MPFKITILTEKGEKGILIEAEKAVHNTSLDLIELQNEFNVPVAYIPPEIQLTKLQEGVYGYIDKGKGN